MEVPLRGVQLIRPAGRTGAFAAEHAIGPHAR
jgi:hypothetical protein